MEKVVQRSFNVLGSIAVVNFSDVVKASEKKRFAIELIKRNNNIKTVLEKSGNFKGRLRKMKTRFLAGENTKEVLYRENNCVFRFNIDTTYFSPRLSNERKEITSIIKKNSDVFVMFAGVAPFSIVIAKNSSVRKVYSNEINREANKYGRLNAELNKVKHKIEFVDGDIKRISVKLKKEGKNFDFIVMPRPNLKDSFLEQAFMLSKKGTTVFYYDFCRTDEVGLVIDKIKNDAKEFGKKIKILKWKPAGETAPYKIRLRVDFKVL